MASGYWLQEFIKFYLNLIPAKSQLPKAKSQTPIARYV